MASKQYSTLKISYILHALIISFNNAVLQSLLSFRRNLSLREQSGSEGKVCCPYTVFFVLNHILIFEEMSKNILPHTGPHFVEYLSFEVTPECDVHLKCKVRL